MADKHAAKPAAIPDQSEAMRASLSDIAAVCSEATDELVAIATAALAMLNADTHAVLTVGQLLLTIRDRAQALDNAVAVNCEQHDCGFVPHRLDALHARLDGAKGGAA
jgi:hypothetical protein